jgi:hypothetical protein
MRKGLKKKLALHKETLQTLDVSGVVGGKLAPVTFTCDTYTACSYTCTTSYNGVCNSGSCYTTTTA